MTVAGLPKERDLWYHKENEHLDAILSKTGWVRVYRTGIYEGCLLVISIENNSTAMNSALHEHQFMISEYRNWSGRADVR
jgi:hypothetical protein